MSFLDNVKNFFVTTEQHVVAIIMDLKTDVEVGAADIDKGLKWVLGQTPQVAAAVTEVEQIIAQLAPVVPGLSTNATVNNAIKQANAAVDALNAAVGAANTGKNDAQALTSGYVAYQSAISAAASAKALALATPTAATTASAT